MQKRVIRERDIERKFVMEAKRRGGLAWKFISPGNDGVPDRIVLLPGGRMAFAELKAPGKKPRPLQVKRKRQLESLGFRVYVIDGKEQIGDAIDEITDGRPDPPERRVQNDEQLMPNLAEAGKEENDNDV